jgi:FtsH-binding integral membrane protein
MRFLRGVYVVAIAGLLIALVIAGVEAFYPAPQYPEYPERPPPYDSPEYEEWEQERMEAQEEYQQEVAIRDKNMFFIVLPLGVLLAVGGIFIRRRLDIFGAGLILGGLGTIIYTTVPYDLDNKLRFVGIAVALAVLVFVGYKVFLSLRTR